MTVTLPNSSPTVRPGLTPDGNGSGFRKSVEAEPARRGLRHLVAFDHCRVLLPQFAFLQRRDPVSLLHRLAFAEPKAAARTGPFAIFLARILFATVILRQLPLYLFRYGAYVARNHGIDRWHQIRDLWHCAWQHNQFPRHYYWRKLFLLPDRMAWLDYLEHRQVNALLAHLNRHLPVTRATNKFLFYHHCLEHCLPTPEVLAAWTDRGHLITAVPAPRAHNLIVKPLNEYGSVGITVIPFDASTHTHRFDGSDLAWPELLAILARHAQTMQRSMLLQRLMHNAPRIAAYGENDVTNLRIVTGHPPFGTPEAIAAFIRLPSSLTTTGHDRHVLLASVDIGNGRMGTGRFREITLGEFPRHPDTLAPIAGQYLSGWSDMLALALRAHRTFPWLPFVGWDIIDTEQGIMLLEANAYWGADALQLPGTVPLGRTRFPEIYLDWFDFFFGTAAATVAAPDRLHS